VIFWYIISGILQWMTTPVIGKMTATLQKLEGQYRYVQSELLKHSEEIALYSGQEWE
jgi:ATP-binding cassette, subfamily D (ALD), member 3